MPDDTVSGLMGKIGSAHIDMKPEFQRNYIWTLKTQRLFIDSILRDYKIPPVWFWRHENDVGDMIDSVIDGQQRLHTLWRYMRNEFHFNPDDSDMKVKNKELDALEKAYYDDLPDPSKGTVLPTDFRKAFRNYRFDYIVVESEDVEFVRDLFKRLNTTDNKLTPQEIRNALYFGDFKTYIYKKVKTIRAGGDGGIKWWSSGSRVFKNDNRDRMGAEQYLSEIIVALHKGSVQHKTKHVDEYYQTWDSGWGATTTSRKALDKRLDRILGTLREAFHGSESRMTKNKSEAYSLIMAIDTMSRDPLLLKAGVDIHSPVNRKRIGKALKHFRNAYIQYIEDLNSGKKEEGHSKILDKYRESIMKEIHTLEARQARHMILTRVIEPSLVEFDPQRLFSKDQKDLIWDTNDNKECALCAQTVTDYDDYEPDHIDPHSAGGATCISNGQVTHRVCNRQKGNSNNDETKIYKPIFNYGKTQKLEVEPTETEV